MREYPYIGKLNDDNGIVLFTENSYGCQLNASAGGWCVEDICRYDDTEWYEKSFTNITKEYLENKCVKIESPEHSEFVQKLAFKAGYSWNFGKGVSLTDKEYLFFKGSQILWDRHNEDLIEEIQLPIPPNNNLQEDEGIQEWKPVIGEKAIACVGEKQATVVTIAYFGEDDCVLVFDDRQKKPFWVCKSLLKPLSKEDVILQEVITFLEDAEGLGSKVTAIGLVEKFNIEMKGE